MLEFLNLPWFIRYRTLEYVLTSTCGSIDDGIGTRLYVRSGHGDDEQDDCRFPFTGVKPCTQYQILCRVSKQIARETRTALLRTSTTVVLRAADMVSLSRTATTAELSAIRYVATEVNYSYENDSKSADDREFDCLDIRYDALRAIFPSMTCLDVMQNPGSDKGHCQPSFASLIERHDDDGLNDHRHGQPEESSARHQQQQHQHGTRAIFGTAWGNEYHLSDMVYRAYANMGTQVEIWLVDLIAAVHHHQDDNVGSSTSNTLTDINTGTGSSTTTNTHTIKHEGEKRRKNPELRLNISFQCGADPRLQTENLSGQMSTTDFVLYVQFQGRRFWCPQASFPHHSTTDSTGSISIGTVTGGTTTVGVITSTTGSTGGGRNSWFRLG